MLHRRISRLISSGNGDKFVSGAHLRFPPVVIRPNTSEEACPDLRAEPPAFDACTVPMVIWARWPFNLGEAFGTVFARLLKAVDSGALHVTPDLLPVLAMPHGLRAPR